MRYKLYKTYNKLKTLRDKKMENKSNSYNELQIIINQQSILSRKVGILLAINTIFITSIVTISFTFNFWFLFLLLPWIISSFLNIIILYPDFKNDNDSKYFHDYADMDISDIKKYIEEENKIANQIKINSKILKKKYNYYEHALSFSFLLLPYLFKIKKYFKSKKY